jgi:mitotic spindle assembly checkpoint protein MAD1
LAEREIGFLKAMVASYQAEELNAVDEGKIDELKGINDLEALFAEYKSTLASLPSPSLPSPPSTTPPSSPSPKQPPSDLLTDISDLKSQLAAAEQSNTEHLERIDELEQQLFDLQGEIAGGRHVPPNTRILSLVDNPEQQWFNLRQSTMDKLQEENAALIKRLQELDTTSTSSHPVPAAIDTEETKPPLPTSASTSTPPSPSSRHPQHPEPQNGLIPLASYTLLQSTLTSLQSELSAKEKRLLRLKQVFHSKAAEFREAIAAILGVKLAFYPNGQVRATSVFDLNASFVFQPSSSSAEGAAGGREMKMQLVAQGEGGPQDLPSLMQYWIENEQCPTGFLAAVTLECYDKAKRDAETGGGS